MPQKPSKKSKPQKEVARLPFHDLAVEEWDFSDCPKEQLHHCRYYEYARERKSTKERVEHLRKNQLPTNLYPGDWDFYRMEWFSEFFSSLHGFPDTSWLRLDEKIREEVLRKCRNLEEPFMTVSPERLKPERDARYPYEPSDVGVLALHLVYAVEVDWTASDDAILNKFRFWLKDNRPTSELINSQIGLTPDAELLKFLGAFRLLRAFGGDWQSAKAFAKKNGRGALRPIYEDQSGWIRASKKAQREIEPPTGDSHLTPVARLSKKLSSIEMDGRARAMLRLRIAQSTRDEQRRLIALEKKEGLEAVIAELKMRIGDTASG